MAQGSFCRWNVCAVITSLPVEVESITMSTDRASMTICPLACLKNYMSRLHKIFGTITVRVNCGHGSVLLGRQCDMLCISDFVDGVMFVHSWLYGSWLRGHIVKVTHQKAAQIFPSEFNLLR